MYRKFFNLQTSPFGTSPDPRFLYMMPHTREALAGLEYGISERKGFTVLTGEVGTGKTTLLRCALGSLGQRRVSTSFVFNPLLDPLDFLEFVLTDFGLTPTSRTKSGMLLQLNRWLIERFRMQETCVVVVDEAQNLSWELLEEIRLLTNLESVREAAADRTFGSAGIGREAAPSQCASTTATDFLMVPHPITHG